MRLSTMNLDRVLMGVLSSFRIYPMRNGKLRLSKYLTDGNIYYIFEVNSFVIGYTEDYDTAMTLAGMAADFDFESFYRFCRIGY